jgi:hypothetical protein
MDNASAPAPAIPFEARPAPSTNGTSEMTNSIPFQYSTLCKHFPDLARTSPIESAFDYARDYMPDYLFNHVTRSWIFASRVAEKNSIKYDAEVVAVSTLMHDMGLTAKGKGPNRFEVNGAIMAAGFVRQLGFDDRRTQLVWDSIALHATSSISLFKEAEVALCARGIGVDFGTPDYGAFSKPEIDDIVAAVPRLNMLERFSACCCHMAETRPETTYDNFIRDFGERYVPGYKAPSLVDQILSGPYSE